jgi:hypothetical protein
MTNLDLTSQFILDYEKLCKKAERPVEPPPVDPKLLSAVAAKQEEIERLEVKARRLMEDLDLARSRVNQLEGDREKFQSQLETATLNEKKKGEEVVAKHQELALVRRTFKLKFEDLKKSHSEELEGEKARSSRALQDSVREIEARFAEDEKLLTDQIRRKVESGEAKISEGLKSRFRDDQDKALREINRQLVRLASVPLRMRLMGLILDVSILIVVASAMNSQLPTVQFMSPQQFQLAILAAFSMRTFVSPGNILLGISARQVGADLRETKRAGFIARLFCGILHYGPLLAMAIVASLDPRATPMWDLLWSDVHAFQNVTQISSPFRDLEASASPNLLVVLLVSTLLWWGLLVLSILVSPLIHRSKPYFRNTTLVESMWRVGFRRFTPPLLDAPEIE